MSDHVWNLSEERVYRIGIAGDWRDRMAKFLKDNSYRIVTNRPNKYILKAEQRGLHVNFKVRPELCPAPLHIHLEVANALLH